jgi:hypothetical protein
MTVQINNCSPTDLNLPKGSIIGFFKHINPTTIQEFENDIFINAVYKVSLHFPPPLSVSDQKEFLKKLKLSVPRAELPLYFVLLLKNHEVFSKNKYDLGCATKAIHKIHVKMKPQLVSNNFRIPNLMANSLIYKSKNGLKWGLSNQLTLPTIL